MCDLGETAVNACYSGFGKHCVEVHPPTFAVKPLS